MLADPSAAAGSIAVDGDVIRASVAAAWRTLVAVVEVIAAHDAHETIVMGEGEADTHGIFLRLSRHTDVKEIKILKKIGVSHSIMILCLFSVLKHHSSRCSLEIFTFIYSLRPHICF